MLGYFGTFDSTDGLVDTKIYGIHCDLLNLSIWKRNAVRIGWTLNEYEVIKMEDT